MEKNKFGAHLITTSLLLILRQGKYDNPIINVLRQTWRYSVIKLKQYEGTRFDDELVKCDEFFDTVRILFLPLNQIKLGIKDSIKTYRDKVIEVHHYDQKYYSLLDSKGKVLIPTFKGVQDITTLDDSSTALVVKLGDEKINYYNIEENKFLVDKDLNMTADISSNQYMLGIIKFPDLTRNILMKDGTYLFKKNFEKPEEIYVSEDIARIKYLTKTIVVNIKEKKILGIFTNVRDREHYYVYTHKDISYVGDKYCNNLIKDVYFKELHDSYKLLNYTTFSGYIDNSSSNNYQFEKNYYYSNVSDEYHYGQYQKYRINKQSLFEGITEDDRKVEIYEVSDNLEIEYKS